MLEKTKEVLEIICNDDLFKKHDIRFVGGTALSYRINHRLSEDLDFATLNLSPKDISNMIYQYGGRIIVSGRIQFGHRVHSHLAS